MLRGLSVKKRHHFYSAQLGSERTVLFEGENKKGYITGFTDNYVKVRIPWDPSLVNTMHTAVLETIDEEGFVRIGLL
jgi:threonylcarbamoyladenosine tRNA methylthiotransferase MtaB